MDYNHSSNHLSSKENFINASYRMPPALSLQSASGFIPYGMTNDYMFRAVLQSDPKALKGLVCALLHLPESEVVSVTVTNPIILGASLTDKECRLDINVLLNSRIRINLEMQVANRLNWPERSILYLCRTFAGLERGLDYAEAQPAIHIGFLDYTLFKEDPRFYATYKLMEVETKKIYSDKFALNVIDLTQIDLATEMDKKYHIHFWAELFKATTWEEINMLASKDEYLNAASNSIFRFNTDEQIRKLCLDREEYYQDLRNYERVIAQKDALLEKAVAEKNSFLAERDISVAQKDAALAERDISIAQKDAALAENKKLLAEIERLRKQLHM